MDESTLNKPVNLQNLSLALAKTRSAISGEIHQRINEIPHSDWYAQEITDEEGNITGYGPGFITNKPAVVSDTGKNSVNLNSTAINAGCCTGDYSTHIGAGSLYQNSALKLTGDANATTYTYTLVSTYSQMVNGLFNHFGNNIQVYLGNYADENPRIQVVSVDQENSTITIETTLSSEEALNSATAGLRWTARAEGDGSISINGGQALGDCSLAMYSNFANGSRSVAFGLRNIADGSQSLATGNNTTASALASHAEGYGTVASGSYSHAEGYYAVASAVGSHSEGSHSEASGNYSHAEGFYTVASGRISHAQGFGSVASGDYSQAFGVSTKASGDSSYAEGRLSIASNTASHAEGNFKTTQIKLTGSANSLTYTFSDDALETLEAFNEYGITTNNRLKISNIQFGVAKIDPNNLPSVQSIDFANKTITLDKTISETADYNDSSLYVYIGNQATGSGSHAEGSGTLASAMNSHAEGGYSSATGDISHAEGWYTRASGSVSHAEGRITQAIGTNTHAQGLGTIAAKGAQFTLGTYNIEDTGENAHPYGEGDYGQYAVILGNGIDVEHRSNAHTIDWTGKGWFASTVSAGTIATPATVVNANDLTTKAYVDSAIANAVTEERVNALIAAALAQYGDGDIASYGFINANEEAY